MVDYLNLSHHNANVSGLFFKCKEICKISLHSWLHLNLRVGGLSHPITMLSVNLTRTHNSEEMDLSPELEGVRDQTHPSL